MRYFLLPRRTSPGATVDPLLRVRPERVPGRGACLGGRRRGARDPGAARDGARARRARGAEPRVRRRSGSPSSGASAASARGARAAALRARVPARRRRVRCPLDGAPRRRRPVRRDRGRGRRSSSSVAGAVRRPVRLRRTSQRGIGCGPGRRRSRGRLGGRHRARRALPRGPVPHRAAAEPPGVRRLGVLGAEGQGDLLLPRPRRARVHDDPERPVPAAAADPRRRGLPRDGRRGRGHPARAVLVPRRRRRRARSPGCSIVTHPRGSSGRPSCSSSSCRASRSACSCRRRTCSWTSSWSSRPCCSRCGSATGPAGASPRPRCCSPVR